MSSWSPAKYRYRWLPSGVYFAVPVFRHIDPQYSLAYIRLF